MTRVLVVWEDEYWKPLGGIVKHLVRARAPAPDAEAPTVLGHTTRSNSAFDRYVRVTWPIARLRGQPEDAGPIDHLVCVVDADRLHDLLPADVPHPPVDTEAVAAWHAAAEIAWRDRLRAQCDPAGPPATTVHGVVQRWAKESLLLAGYDQPAMEAHLDVAADHPDVAQVLSSCKPRPQAVADARFTDTYRRPSSCLKLLREARKLGVLHKSAPEIDDALRALGRESLTRICDRVPDVARIAALVWKLHHDVHEPTMAPTVPARAGSAGRRPAGRDRKKKGPGAR